MSRPNQNVEAPDTVPEDLPDVVGTPEGDNEFAPDQPLGRVPADAEEKPRGGAPEPYKGE